MVLVKKLKFYHLWYLSKIDREKVFLDVLGRYIYLNKRLFSLFLKTPPSI